ncbi:type II toxin-antitoxin system VapC family toxin [Aquabacterium sp.]|uniref:type II toxin-antitoxin system VapC family toxin n=1 Tax=Aquabacterium sp. TaxID=1872578 RepID=UPI002B96ADED|nr:type II toxin-antitoxin system VapC family toxin [Aquabacterium sp.]HSW09116.1 type II toxin-antitoxin system VapC family toxin [Aquabacterium sp.]
MKFLLDTNTLIYLIKQRPLSVAARMNQLTEHDSVAMSFVTWAELLKGAEGSDRRADVLRRLEQLARQIPVVYETSHRLCEHYAAHSTRLKTAGTPIGANDLWIACHALALEATLVTNNLREFERIIGLRLDNWAD